LSNPDFRTSFLEASSQQDQTTLKVVFESGKIERLVEPEPSVCKLHGSVRARMRSRRPSSQMPPLGTSIADEQAAELVQRWIESLKIGARP